MRIGLGWDIHPLATNRKLILGGVQIPFSKGLQGHSDADVLCHSLSDALLGAAGIGDIGQHFPDTDPTYLGASSVELLKKVSDMVRTEGFEIVNLDSVVITDEPKISSFKDDIRKNLSIHLGIHENMINLKGKRAEGLGSIGKGEGIAAMSVALLRHAR